MTIDTLVPVEGGNPAQLTRGPGQHLQMNWAPDGQSSVFEHRSQTVASIARIDHRGDAWSDPVKLADLPAPAAANPAFSPDGRFALYIEGSGAVERTCSPGHPRGSAIWYAPISGSARLVTAFEDPDRQPTRYGFVLHEGRLYFTHGQRQADISVVTLESRE